VTTIAINGLGRIGRAFLKAALTHTDLRIVAVNDLIDPENLVYLMRFDSAYGRYDQPVAYESGAEPTLRVGRTSIRLLREREPARLPWKKLGVDIVIEATGAFATFEQARAHITAGAQRVVLTAPAKDADSADARTVLVGVNEDQLEVSVLSSNGSCDVLPDLSSVSV